MTNDIYEKLCETTLEINTLLTSKYKDTPENREKIESLFRFSARLLLASDNGSKTSIKKKNSSIVNGMKGGRPAKKMIK